MRRVMVEEQGCGSDLQEEEVLLQSRAAEQTAAPEAKTALTTELKHGSEYVSLRWGVALGNKLLLRSLIGRSPGIGDAFENESENQLKF